MVWIQAGFAMVVLSAAIKAIPTDVVEAARLDGVSSWQMFWRITMPSIRPALIVVVVTISIATLKLFDIVRTATNGNYDTNVIATEMYNQAFRYGQTGQGSALAVFLFVLVIPIVIYQVRNLRKQREA
jgi:alpha-glucoside transport system permease protein